MATVEKVRAVDLLARLRRHYLKPGPFPGGVFIGECGLNQQTTVQQRRCDAVYVGFTSTSGRLLIGHELKVSKADWMHELDQPGKADIWADNCHEWYVVAPTEAIVPPETLPHGWGLLVIDPRTKTRLRTVVKPIRVTVEPSWVVVRSIMARLDTLQVQAMSDYRRELQAQFAEDREKMRAEWQAAGATVDSRSIEEQTIREAIAIIRRADRYTPLPNAAELAAAAADLHKSQALARELRQHLARVIGDMQRATAPLDQVSRNLAELINEVRV